MYSENAKPKTGICNRMIAQIIYINGPSSSGKTTLAKALQQVFDQPFLHIGIDRVIGMMPVKFIKMLSMILNSIQVRIY